MIRKFIFLLFFGLMLNQNVKADDDWCVQNGGKIGCTVAEQFWVSPRGERSYSYNSFLDYACIGTAIPYERCQITGIEVVYPLYGNMPQLKVDVNKKYYYYDHELEDYVLYYEHDGIFVLISYRECPPNHIDENIPPYDNSNWIKLCKPYNQVLPTKSIPNESKQEKNMCTPNDGSSAVGDPIDIASGNKTLSEVDYRYNSNHELIIKRDYSAGLGVWRFDFQRDLSYSNVNGEYVVLNRQNGQLISFKKVNGSWQLIDSNQDFSMTEESNGNLRVLTPSLETESYELTTNEGNFKTYRLSSIENNKKQTWLYEYTGVYLTKISNKYGKEMLLEYGDMCTHIPTSITVSGDKKFQYEYTAYCNLTKVTYPDLTSKMYTYNAYIGNAYYGITQVIDENGNINQQTTYDLTSKASSESMGDSGQIEKMSLSYAVNQVQIQDGNNNISLVNTEKVNNFTRITGYDSYCPTCSGFQGSLLTYDSRGFVNGVKDYKNIDTGFQYNTAGKLTQVKNAVGTTVEKQIDYTYDSAGKYVTSKTEPVSGGSKVTTYSYDNNKNVTGISITAPKNDGSSATITKNLSFIYDLVYSDHLIEIRGVNYALDNNDKISMTYNSDGQIHTITNELGQVTTYSSYDDYGNPNQVVMPNASVINFTYDLRGRITTSSIKSSLLATDTEVTTYTYDNAGLLIKLTNPSLSFNKMTYDKAHRLTKVEEYSAPTTANPNGVYLGKVEYTLDNMSKATSVKVFNAYDVEERVTTSEYDNKNRLLKTIGNLNQTTTYNYDANSNLSQVTDAGDYSFGKTYDALNRVVSMSYPDSSSVSITYHPNNDIATITDQKGLTTTYTYDGFSNVIKIESPDTGVTLLSYDKKNNLISKQDNKNQVLNYTYDLLGRLKTVTYVGTPSEDIILTYDVCKVGNICTIVDNSGTTTYTYNGKARLLSKTFNPTGNTLSFTTSYTYDSFGNVSEVSYPSISTPNFSYTGSNFGYTYINDKITSISKSTTPIISNVQYPTLSNEPTSFNSGIYTYEKDISLDGVVTSINNSQASSYSKNYTYDSRFNIKSIDGQSNPVTQRLSADYDSKSRIVETEYIDNGVTNSIAYGYNTSDDRTSITKDNSTDNYNYPTNSHKLSNINGVDAFIYDSNGNTVESNANSLEINMTYNKANRLVSSSSSLGDAIYTYNALNQRVKKEVTLNGNTATTWFVYDEIGQLIADYTNKDNVWSVNEYVYLYNKPVAVIKDSQVHHIQTDHLNTPRSITKASDGSLVWNWENKEVFGNSLPNENLSGSLFKFNLRFPGQYWDEEKGSSYNYHRDYAPGLGRYLQSDPIGLNGGINTYGYVSGNSLSYVDPKGQYAVIVPMIIGSAMNAFAVSNAGGTTSDIVVAAGIGAVVGLAVRFPLMLGVELNFTGWTIYSGILSVINGGVNRRAGFNTQSHENIGYDIGINFIAGAISGGFCSSLGASLGAGTASINSRIIVNDMGMAIGGELGALNGNLWSGNAVNYSNYFRGLN